MDEKRLTEAIMMIRWLKFVYIFILRLFVLYKDVEAKPPHILFIVADDLGKCKKDRSMINP